VSQALRELREASGKFAEALSALKRADRRCDGLVADIKSLIERTEALSQEAREMADHYSITGIPEAPSAPNVTEWVDFIPPKGGDANRSAARNIAAKRKPTGAQPPA